MVVGNEEQLRLFTRVFLDLMSRGFELVTHGLELDSRGFELETNS